MPEWRSLYTIESAGRGESHRSAHYAVLSEDYGAEVTQHEVKLKCKDGYHVYASGNSLGDALVNAKARIEKRNSYKEARDRVVAHKSDIESLTIPDAPKQYSILVARFPGQNQEHPDSSNWVISAIRKMDKDPRISKVGRFTRSDTPITMVRNLAVKTALDAGIDYLLMIDSDMSPDIIATAPGFWETAWEFMMRRRKFRWLSKPDGTRELLDDKPATIAAPYCGPPPNECVYVFRWKNSETGTPEPQMKLEMISRESAAHMGGIEEVAALPTGLILYDMRVFKKMDPPWFDYEWSDKYRTKKASTEDVFQTRNASLLGMPQCVAWDCWAAHVKLKKVGKPVLVTVDQVREELANAVRRNVRSDEQVRNIGSDLID